MCCNHLFIFTIYNSLFSPKKGGYCSFWFDSGFLLVSFSDCNLDNPPISTTYNSLNIHLYMNSVCLKCPFPLLPTKLLLVNFKTEVSLLPLLRLS